MKYLKGPGFISNMVRAVTNIGSDVILSIFFLEVCINRKQTGKKLFFFLIFLSLCFRCIICKKRVLIPTFGIANKRRHHEKCYFS